MLQVFRKNQFNLHDIQINKRAKQTGKLDRITLNNTKNKSKERRNSKKEKGSYFILYLQIIFMSKIILRLISYGWDDKFYEKYMYNLIQTHIIYIYIFLAILHVQRKWPSRISAFTKVKNVFPSERAIILRIQKNTFIRVVLYCFSINLPDAMCRYVIANM